MLIQSMAGQCVGPSAPGVTLDGTPGNSSEAPGLDGSSIRMTIFIRDGSNLAPRYLFFIFLSPLFLTD